MPPIGRLLLIVAYGVLGLAAAGRSAVQISTRLSEAPVPYLVSGASAVLYVLIAVALWRGWRQVALWGTGVELVGVLTVGTLGYVQPSWWPDETVWTGYGSAYGWVPLVLPIVALVVLLRAKRPALVAD
ncbi:hypothetical protein [Demequina muriae]|uniref:Integral membrane protein n=1 Tax=Demequina muriae TaxID=3051664 RepID=A0ABT8GJ49_9MICO|nr:hypothetical protein [Demequina sp. EGI L300058]MDN4481458.1 hypothetical protein [Demequina sp. EGI L300058]